MDVQNILGFGRIWISDFQIRDVQPVGPLEKYLKRVDRHTRTCTPSHLLSNPGIQAEMSPCPELERNSGSCEIDGGLHFYGMY